MSRSQFSRRQLLKVLAAAAGTAVLSSVPNKWKTPVVEVGALPADAQRLSGSGLISGAVQGPGTAAPVANSSPKIALPPTATITAKNTISGLTYQTTLNDPSFPFTYTLSNVPAGTYDVMCAVTGFCVSPATKTDTNIVVPVGGTATANFTFTAGGCG